MVSIFLGKSRNGLTGFLTNKKEIPTDQNCCASHVQGAYNQYYEADLRSWKLPQVFNAKPYHEHNPDAVIVHFHGAKPHDYAQYLATGECPFAQIPEMCESAVKNGYCAYVEDWAGHYRPGDGLDPRFPPTCSRAADPA